MHNLSDWRAMVLNFCKEVNAELLFINESDFSFGVDYGNCTFQHIYPDELYEYYKHKKAIESET
jgi:hypothetical protein